MLEVLSLCVPRSRSGQERRYPRVFLFLSLCDSGDVAHATRKFSRNIAPIHSKPPGAELHRPLCWYQTESGRRDARDTVAALLFWLMLAVSLGIIIAAGHWLNMWGERQRNVLVRGKSHDVSVYQKCPKAFGLPYATTWARG
jgi:hypothetical protein